MILATTNKLENILRVFAIEQRSGKNVFLTTHNHRSKLKKSVMKYNRILHRLGRLVRNILDNKNYFFSFSAEIKYWDHIYKRHVFNTRLSLESQLWQSGLNSTVGINVYDITL